MHFGEVLDEDRYQDCIRVAYEAGIRTFVTADVYGQGKADAALGEVLSEYPRESYCLVGMLGRCHHGRPAMDVSTPSFGAACQAFVGIHTRRYASSGPGTAFPFC